jgi:hypothetical protein
MYLDLQIPQLWWDHCNSWIISCFWKFAQFFFDAREDQAFTLVSLSPADCLSVPVYFADVKLPRCSVINEI